MTEITKADFEAYERVRESGLTNMFHTTNVSELSGLDKETIRAIMTRYDSLCKKWPEVRK